MLPLLTQCAAVRAGRLRPAPPLPPPASEEQRHPEVALVADAALQRLIDPYPAAEGPSWLGADVASSVRLADDRWVWLFGDTLLGTIVGDCSSGGGCRREVRGPGAGMIANSVGTMVLGADGAPWPVVKYWRTEDDAPAPIFSTPEEGFLWPLAGVRVGTVLLVAANRHTFASGLVPVDNVLVRVWNPDAPPDAWLYDVHRFPGFVPATDGGRLVSWTSALVLLDGMVYALGSRDVGLEAEAVLSRFPADAVTDADWRLEPEYLTQADDGGAPYWSSALDVAHLYVIPGLPGTSESTLDFAPGVGWYTFQIPALRYEIRMYTADDLLGPWRDQGIVYEIPPPWSTTTRGYCPEPPPLETPPEEIDPACERVFSAYAAKAHPELAPAGGHAVSYNVNVWAGGLDAAIEALETMPAFYVPRMLATPPGR